MNTTQLVAAARAEIVAVIQANLNVSMGAKFVRLAFHDCVGGCDGCVDMANLDNTGLNTPINALDSVVTKYTVAGTNLTRADIWALAGLTGAGNAQNTTSIDFALTYIGRPVCANLANGAPATRAGPDRTLPSAHLSTTQVLAFFASNFGFTETETVAIMGAHTL
jgi:Peroxidase